MREIFVSGLYGNWKKNLASIAGVVASGSARVYYNPGQKNIAEDVDRVVRLIAISEIVFLNKDEALEIVLKCEKEDEQREREDEKYLIQKIAELGARCVVITDGSRGAWAGDKENCYRAKSRPIKHIVDSTGAGDAFSGAFLAAYLQNKNVVECLRWGIANGGSVVQYYGSSRGLLTSREIQMAVKHIEVIVV
jgi:sugar/nucleoside kinase (ribokinase family)